MFKRTLKRFLLVLIVLAFSASLFLGIQVFKAHFQPPLLKRSDLACDGCNLILISVDTLRADHLSAYGYEKRTSPFLDEAKKEAILFSSMVSTASVTPDAHMSLFTSLMPSVHGVKVKDDHLDLPTVVRTLWREYLPTGLDERFTTLAEFLTQQGYATAAVTGGGYLDPSFGFGQGFERYVTISTLYETGPLYEEATSAVEYLNESRPFFLFLHTYIPHDPYVTMSEGVDFLRQYNVTPVVRDNLRETAGDDRVCIPFRDLFWQQFNLSKREDVEKLVAFYDSKIYAGDRFLEKLFTDLRSRGLMENSLIVLLSDHGEEFLEHGGTLHGGTLYREVLHVPLVIWSPSKTEKLIPQPFSLLDVMPTLIESLGFEVPPHLQGHSLFGWRKRAAIPSEVWDKSSLMENGWKYVYREDGHEEAYNLQEDPWEQENVALQNQEVLDSFRRELQRQQEENQRLKEEILG